jgi:autotransporter-associated beta strand protein
MNSVSRSLLVAASIALATVPVQAGPIAWGGPLTIGADTDVANAGALQYGYTLSNSTQTVNGVTFSGANSTTSLGGGNVTFSGFDGGNTGSAYSSGSAPFSSLSSAYRTVLQGGNYSNGATPVTTTLNSLTSGRTYLVQVWVGDPRSGGTTTRTETLAGANTQTLDYNVGNTGGAVGQYALGLFTADSASQSFSLLGDASTQINALQVRDVTNLARWTGNAGQTLTAASGANFATNASGAALTEATFDAAKALIGGVVFADTYFNGGSQSNVAASSITLGSAVSAGTLFFENAAASYSVTSSGANAIGGSTLLAKSGSGTVTLNGANTHTGGTVVTAGTLAVDTVTALGSGLVSIRDGATLDYLGTGAETLANALWMNAGAATVKVSSATGSLTLSPASGTRNQSLTKTGNGTLTLGGALSGSASVNVTGGTLVLTAANTHTGATSVSAGATLQVGDGGTSGALAGGAIANDGTLTYSYSSSGTATLGAVTGTGALAASGRNVVLTGNITQGGAVTLSQSGNAGSLYDGIELNKAGTTSITAGSISLSGDIGKRDSNGNTLALSTASANGTIALNVSLGRDGVWYSPDALVANAGTGIITVSGDGNGSNGWRNTPVTLSGGAVNVTGDVVSSASVSLTHSVSSSLSGVFSGSMGLSKGGAGTLTVDAVQGFSGALSLSGGTYLVNVTASSNASALGSGGVGNTVSVGQGAILEFKSGLTRTAGYHQADVTVRGGEIKADSGDINLAAGRAITFADAPGTLSGSGMVRRRDSGNSIVVEAAASGSQITVADLNLLNNAPLFTVANGAQEVDLTVSGNLSGSEGFAKAGDGRMRLTAALTHSGGVSVNAGQLTLANTSASVSYAIASGATLELDTAGSNRSYSSATFSGAGTLVAKGGQQLIWGSSAATFALDSGSLIDVQSGTFIGGSTANEVWTNNRSDLQVAANALFRGVEANVRVDALSGAGEIRSGWSGEGYQRLAFGVDNGGGTFSGVLANDIFAGNFAKLGAGTQVLTGVSTFTGSLAVEGGRLEVAGSGQLGSGSYAGAIALSAGATLALQSSAAQTLSGVISGEGSLRKSDSGLLVLSVENSYAGGTEVAGGTLRIGHAGSLGTGTVSVAGGTLDLNSLNPANVIRFTSGSIINDGNWTSGSIALVGAVDAASVNALTAPVVSIGAGASINLNGVTRAITLDGGSISAFGNFSGTLNLLTSLDLDGAGGSPVSTSAAIVVGAGATLSGTGTVASIAGAGSVGPGNSPGILVSSSLDPSAGTDFNLEFTQPTPNWSSPSASDNDVIRLTGSTPFASAMTSANVVNLYLSFYDANIGPSPTLDDTFVGGFYTDVDVDFLASVQLASFNFYLPVPSGGVSYNGQAYALYSGNLQFDVQTVRLTGAFEEGANGYAMQIRVVPEPSTYGLMLGALALAGAAFRRRRAR